MNRSQLEADVLRVVNGGKYKPAKPREIAKLLRLSADDTKDIRKVVKQLVKSGQLAYGPNHVVLPAGGSRDTTVTGKFQRTAGGYGFIRPLGTKKSSGRTDDIFVPVNATMDAANGDTVVARLTRKRRGPTIRTTGEIVDIVARHTRQFVGTYFEERDRGYVQVDGSDFPLAVDVGDPGAKNAHAGDKVVIEMVSFPKASRHGEAVITEVLGRHGQPGVDTLLIIREFGLPDAFPEDALEAAREAAAAFDETDLTGRRDLTEHTVLTIDPIDARDFDDAISLERLENGHWRLGVHIADVAHFVRPKSALDAEARNRATSVYLPDRVIPMLPEIISNNLASLQPDRVRFTKTAFIEFTADGARVATEAFSAAIKSDRRFTYEEVDDYLAEPESWRDKLQPAVHQLLAEMHELAMVLRRRRLERGAIELTMREVKIDLDADGTVTGAHKVENTVSHQIIEEFMLSANMAVAEMLRDREIKFLRRLHESPDPKKLAKLTEFARHLGFDVESLESRFETKRLLEMVVGEPEEYAVNYAVLRSFQKAVYGPEDGGHYALASDCYCHFTSPIRRYPDLTVHRLIDDLESGKTPGHDLGHLIQLGEHCSEREQRAEKAERELTKLKLLGYFSDRIGEKMAAVITGVESFGFFVLGLEIPAEGLVHVESLEDDQYDYDDSIHALQGRHHGHAFSLGDEVEVEIAEVDLDRRELDFRFIRRIQSRHAAQASTAAQTKRSDHRKASAKSAKTRKADERRQADANGSTTRRGGAKPKRPRGQGKPEKGRPAKGKNRKQK